MRYAVLNGEPAHHLTSTQTANTMWGVPFSALAWLALLGGPTGGLQLGPAWAPKPEFGGESEKGIRGTCSPRAHTIAGARSSRFGCRQLLTSDQVNMPPGRQRGRRCIPRPARQPIRRRAPGLAGISATRLYIRTIAMPPRSQLRVSTVVADGAACAVAQSVHQWHLTPHAVMIDAVRRLTSGKERREQHKSSLAPIGLHVLGSVHRPRSGMGSSTAWPGWAGIRHWSGCRHISS